VIGVSSSTMSVKGQLTASRDFLMAAIRASTRGATPNEHAGKVLQACLELIEQLTRKADLLSADEVQTASRARPMSSTTKRPERRLLSRLCATPSGACRRCAPRSRRNSRLSVDTHRSGQLR
jgi:hypothetical protein